MIKLLVCMFAGIGAGMGIGLAGLSAGVANKVSAKTLNRFTGIVLTTLAVIMIGVQYLM